MTNAARTIWPHLKDGDAPPQQQQQQQRTSPLAQAMWPSLALKERTEQSLKLSRDLRALTERIPPKGKR